MIELLLQAERALSMGLPDEAERLYAQAVAADPRNSIAVVGLARVALERGEEDEAYRLAREALAIDPENVAATRLARRLAEVASPRGLSEPAATTGPAGPPPPPPRPAGIPTPALPPPPPPLTPAPAPFTSTPAPPDATVPAPAPFADRSRLDRLLQRYRP